MNIQISNRQNSLPIPEERLREKIRVILNALACPEGEISVSFVTDEEMQEINRDYRGKDQTTNVLSFAMQEGEFGSLVPNLLGDVLISGDTTLREAATYGMQPGDRLLQLLIHGVLHLFGFDHETGPDAEQEMEEKSDHLMALISDTPDVRGWILAGS